jgi:metal-responsive CopG/Arc/MetJ family transcriptional regulator
MVPEDLLREVDALVGNRKRSDFFVEAAREKLDRMTLRRAAHELAGFLKDADTPHWETPETTSAWVRSLRRESDERAFPRGEET